MARFRNPRYAPEFLERRLCPSDINGLVLTAEVTLASDTEPKLPPPPPYPPIDPSLPPLGDPIPPVGPALPG